MMGQAPAEAADLKKKKKKEERKQSRVVGATTAGFRALASQVFALYVRVPVKLFRPTRIDYLALPRAINPEYYNKPWSLMTHSSPALLTHAVRKYGWNFIPNHGKCLVFNL